MNIDRSNRSRAPFRRRFRRVDIGSWQALLDAAHLPTAAPPRSDRLSAERDP